jgi:hypothetical protein
MVCGVVLMVRCDDAAQAGGIANDHVNTSPTECDGPRTTLQELLAEARQALTSNEDTLSALGALGGIVAGIIALAELLTD